jgi:hypothetical protein
MQRRDIVVADHEILGLDVAVDEVLTVEH